MRLSIPFVAIAICLAAQTPSVAHGNERCVGYIYDAKNAIDNRSVVVNPTTHYVGIQDRRHARVDAQLSDFGGFFINCENEDFFCLTGPLEIVIPKSLPKKQWDYLGLTCKGLREHEGDAIKVTCSSSRMYQTEITFIYSPSRGVLSFGNSPVGGTRGGFKLRGQCGMFMPGHNP